MAKRILLMTQWFDPEPTFKGLVFAKALAKQGFEVEVVTGFPNYPGGKLYPGYRLRWRHKEIIDGIAVTRLFLYPSHDRSVLRRACNYLSFFTSLVLYGVFSARQADVIYAYHPPLTTGLAAALIKLVRRTPLIIDIQDLWPDTLRATGMISNARALGLIGAFCDWMYRRCDHIVVLSPGFKKAITARAIADGKIEVIYNWADEAALLKPAGDVPTGFAKDKFKVLFAGNMGAAQALDSVIEAAALIRDTAHHVQFLFIGGGMDVERLKAVAHDRQLSNVGFLPPVPMSEIGSRLAAADALLVHLKRDPLFEITIPSKTQAYMAAGRPIIMGVTGDAADLVVKADCGVLVEPENAQAIAEAVVALSHTPLDRLAVMAANGRRFYFDQISCEAATAKFARLFDTLSTRT
ncbi:MAG: glycosyltransferase WbuB [Hyphomicrobium sp.]|nr:MAG: glycosyltransferase WbuB [Hyphomicrobium sp.]